MCLGASSQLASGIPHCPHPALPHLRGSTFSSRRFPLPLQRPPALCLSPSDVSKHLTLTHKIRARGNGAAPPSLRPHSGQRQPKRRSAHMPHSLGKGNGAGRGESEEEGEEGKVALLLEVEGVMVDLHKVGHLEAYNAAFMLGGIDWARWNISTYNGLHRGTGGDPAAMLRAFFNKHRWPVDDMDAAAKEVLVRELVLLKSDSLRSAVESSSVPLRPGLVDILEEAVAAGCHVAAMAMQARCGEETARKLLKKLPKHLQQEVLVVGKKEAEGSLFWQVVVKGTEDSPPVLEDALAARLSEAVVARKQEVAQQVAKVLKVRADVDTGGVGPQSTEGVAALRAACERLQVPLARVVVLAGSQGMVQIATRAGIPSIAVRSSLTSQAEFPGALQVYEDFGPGSLTVSRLLRRLGFR